MTLPLKMGGAHQDSRCSYFKITPTDGRLAIGLPHFPTWTNIKARKIKKNKIKKNPNPLYWVASSMRKEVNRSILNSFLFFCIYLPEIQGVYRHRHGRSWDREHYADVFPAPVDNDVVVLPPRKKRNMSPHLFKQTGKADRTRGNPAKDAEIKRDKKKIGDQFFRVRLSLFYSWMRSEERSRDDWDALHTIHLPRLLHNEMRDNDLPFFCWLP